MSPAHSILVIEDEPNILRLVTAALHASGYKNVNAASSISEARCIWMDRGAHFDLIVTDFSLPDGSALDLVDELRAANPSLGVIVMSGYSQDVIAHETSERRIVLLQKPFRPAELCEMVRSSFAVSDNPAAN
jgi:DNA-binding NtrC family response regulator